MASRPVPGPSRTAEKSGEWTLHWKCTLSSQSPCPSVLLPSYFPCPSFPLLPQSPASALSLYPLNPSAPCPSAPPFLPPQSLSLLSLPVPCNFPVPSIPHTPQCSLPPNPHTSHISLPQFIDSTLQSAPPFTSCKSPIYIGTSLIIAHSKVPVGIFMHPLSPPSLPLAPVSASPSAPLSSSLRQCAV